jgi:hypothetical protein
VVLPTVWPGNLRLPRAEVAARTRTRLLGDDRNILDRENPGPEGTEVRVAARVRGLRGAPRPGPHG